DDPGDGNETTGAPARTRAHFDLACHPVKPVQCSSADPGERSAPGGTRHRPACSCSEGEHRARDRRGICCSCARASQRAARRCRHHILEASNSEEIEKAFATLIDLKADALLVIADPIFFLRRSQVVTLAARYAVPTIHPAREFVQDGGLISYGASLTVA